MEGLTETMLEELERQHPEGLPSTHIVSLFEEHGVRFSEATLRKYVQLGLLPRSFRVGHKGSHKGSQGLYPTSVVRQIVEIKKHLGANRTIEEIRSDFFLLRTEIEELEQRLRRLCDGVEGSLKGRTDDTVAAMARRDLRDVRAASVELVSRLRTLESRLTMRASISRSTG